MSNRVSVPITMRDVDTLIRYWQDQLAAYTKLGWKNEIAYATQQVAYFRGVFERNFD